VHEQTADPALSTEVDPAYAEQRLALLYDALNPWGPGDDFYLSAVLRSDSALDIGCGTGALLRGARRAGHRGDLVGLDPAAAMLAIARAHSPDVTWLQGRAQDVRLDRTFQVATMTGHAFQVLLTDGDTEATLATVHRHLRPGGHFLFETRNPAAQPWELWTAEHTKATVRSPGGEAVDVAYVLRGHRQPDLVDFDAVFRWQASGATVTSPSTLRFIDPAHLRALLTAAGFAVVGWYGSWDQSPVTDASPEVIVEARR
jgi:ubiquinone/menaquinone biosynthesis C-methylase UbiE